MNTIENILKKLEKLMHGYNYEVTFGYNFFADCSTIEAFNSCLKSVYRNSRPESVLLTEVSLSDFWEEINNDFAYRGDKTAGLFLTDKKELELETIEKEYKNYLAAIIPKKTKLYSYSDEHGIPGYPVYWDFRFLLMTTDSDSIFIYGSASD